MEKFRQQDHLQFHARSILHKLGRIQKQELFKNQHRSQYQTLTRRELEIIGLLYEGLNSSDISEALFISQSTVKQHRKNINRKLEVKSVARLFHYALAFDIV